MAILALWGGWGDFWVLVLVGMLIFVVGMGALLSRGNGGGGSKGGGGAAPGPVAAGGRRQQRGTGGSSPGRRLKRRVKPMDKGWLHTTDVLVVGSGGGGMTAALMARDCGAEALVIEKGSLYGGSTAMSGGSIWVPCNHLMKKAGLSDSPDEALTYLAAVTAGRVPEERLRTYVSAAPEMVQYLEDKTRVRFQLVAGYSDYYPGLPGARPGGGRTIEAVPFNARKLGSLWAEMQPVPSQARLFGKMMATAGDAHRMVDASTRGRIAAGRIVAAYYLNPFRSLAKADTRLTLGNALIGRLRLSLADRGIAVVAGHGCGAPDRGRRPRGRRRGQEGRAERACQGRQRASSWRRAALPATGPCGRSTSASPSGTPGRWPAPAIMAMLSGWVWSWARGWISWTMPGGCRPAWRPAAKCRT